MIEEYVYNLIKADATLVALFTRAGKFDVYPLVVPRGEDFAQALTFSVITSYDAYPVISSCNVQFNVFASKHQVAVQVMQALAAIFNQDHNHTEGGINVVYSQRTSESDVDYDYEFKQYQRQATYYFKIR